MHNSRLQSPLELIFAVTAMDQKRMHREETVHLTSPFTHLKTVNCGNCNIVQGSNLGFTKMVLDFVNLQS